MLFRSLTLFAPVRMLFQYLPYTSADSDYLKLIQTMAKVEEGEEKGCESLRFKLPNTPLMLFPKAAVLQFPPWAG